MSIFLPPHVAQEILKEKWQQQRLEFQALAARLFEDDDPVCAAWDPVLQGLDERLSLKRARPQAYEPGLNVTPGYYHWYRDNEAAAQTITPITGPDGKSFQEPDSGLLETLRQNDLRDPVVFAALIGRHAAREAAVEAEQHQEHLDRVERIVDKHKALTSASVSMSDLPWTQNNQPAARRDRRSR